LLRQLVPAAGEVGDFRGIARKPDRSVVRRAGFPGTVQAAQQVGTGGVPGVIASIRDDTEPPLGPREAAASIVPLIWGLEVAGQGGGMMEIPNMG
jgi:hypothetical protein